MNVNEAVYYLARNYRKGIQKTLSIEVKNSHVDYAFDGTFCTEELDQRQALVRAKQDVVDALEHRLIKAESQLTDLCF